MSFTVPPDAYDRFMGRYSVQLGPQLADLAGIVPGRHVLDVGCGPGALVAELVSRVGEGSVAAVEPSAPFVAAARERFPGVEVHRASAESLPFPDASFDAALAQLVVHFMADPVGGIREMARVTRPGGVVAACVWDHAGNEGPLTPFWLAVRELDPQAEDESGLAGAREGHLTELFEEAGLQDVTETALTSRVEHVTFAAWWEPFTYGIGPVGAYMAGLDDDRRAELREVCRRLLGDGPFEITARAWAARGLVS
jgi:ubiquinone/menaquinone biosynthesis C-methylase UbiE